jgi:hypothetical protein
VALTSTVQAKKMDERVYIRNNYPNLEQVLTHLNKNLKYECKDCSYGVAKKRDGYHLTFFNYESKKTTSELIWSAAGSNFIDPNFEAHIDINRIRNARSNNFSDIYNQREKFDFMLYFGYDEWTSDVIALLKGYESVLSSQDLEILARAHGELGMNAINSDGPMREYGYVELDQANTLLENAKISMDYWVAIKKKDPAYLPLIIGDIDLKIGNEYMFFFNVLNSIKMEKEAKVFLKKAWFPESYIQSAKNLLYGCTKDGFLFTQGDSDTFPLWYVQKKLDYRNDVIVLNSSLLYTPWFLQMKKEEYKYASVLDQKSYGVLLKKGMYADFKQEKVPFKNWLSGKVQAGDTSKLAYDLVPQSFVVTYQGSNLDIKIPRTTMPHNDLVILDLISSNSQRSFNFVSPYQLYTMGLVDHYLERGKSFELKGEKQDFKSDTESVRQLDNLMFYMEMSYLRSLKHGGSHELNFLCYGIQDLGPALGTDKMRLSGELEKQLPVQQIIKLQNFNVLESMSAFYSQVNPTLNTQLKSEAKPFAMDRIEEVSIINKALDMDIADMEEIFSIYAGVRVQWVRFETPDVSDSDMEVLTALDSKITKLLSSEVIEQREWSKLRLEELNKALTALKTN